MDSWNYLGDLGSSLVGLGSSLVCSVCSLAGPESSLVDPENSLVDSEVLFSWMECFIYLNLGDLLDLHK